MGAVTAEAVGPARGVPFTAAHLPVPWLDGRQELVDGSLLVTRPGRPYEYADLEAMPDDGRRYEILDGVLLVTPAPRYEHQVAVTKLLVVLYAARSPDVDVLVAPFDVLITASVLQPDLLVARRADFTRRDLPVAPLLAVEVLSPSTRRIDVGRKRERYQRAGTAAYWVVDPDVPRLVAWELRDGVYVEVADVSGDEAFAASVPFDVTVTPAALVAG
jgi:Uma2 family endonuclease